MGDSQIAPTNIWHALHKNGVAEALKLSPMGISFFHNLALIPPKALNLSLQRI